jgi:hypothetical protein
MEHGVELRLRENEALVLFEFLSRFSDTDLLEIVDQAEKRVLWNLCCDLERILAEPFLDSYQTRLKKARDEVRDPE